MSFPTILRRSLPTWLVWAVPLAAAAPAPWQSHAPLPEPRTEVAAGVARGELIVVGGFTADGGNSARSDAYSIARNAWRRLPDLPVAVDHAASASAGGNVYVVGGYGGDRNPLKTAFVLGKDETWQRLPALPDARAAAAAAIAGGKLYVVGGVDGRRGLARVAFALDLKSRRWARIPGPSPREHLAAAAAGLASTRSAAAAPGSTRTRRASRSTTPKARRWTRLAPIPQARGGTGAAYANGRIVSVGGERPQGTIAAVYAYELRTKRWRRLPDLPTPRHGLGVVASAGRVCVARRRPAAGTDRQRRRRVVAALDPAAAEHADSSHAPSTPERTKPITERKWIPKICGPSLAKMPIRRRADQPAGDDERDHEAVDDDVDLVHELVEALVHEADLDLAVAHLLEHVVHLVRQARRDLGQLAASRRARRRDRAGVKRSIISSRAYGCRDLEDVEVRIELDADRAERRDRAVEQQETRRQAQVHRIDQVERLADHLERVDLREARAVVAVVELR